MVSAAQVVAEATKELCDAANALVKGLESGERLIAASKQVAASTAQLVIACQVKADPESGTMRSLEGASVAVRKATDNLVQQAQKIFKKDTQSQAHPWETATGVRGMSEVKRSLSHMFHSSALSHQAKRWRLNLKPWSSKKRKRLKWLNCSTKNL